jgi:phosphomannomutase
VTLIKSISGIRGTIGGKPGDSLTPVDVVKFSAAFGMWVKSRNGKKIVIGRDARISGEMVSNLVAATLQGLGLHVVDLGLSTTPTVELAVSLERADGGIILTASHNPIQWNALKLLNELGEFISADDGARVLQLAQSESFDFAPVEKLGKYKVKENYIDKHIELVLTYPLIDLKSIKKAKFKIAVDAVNSTGGIAVPKLLKALGVKTVKQLYCKPDGKFPHNPEPLPENIKEISKVVKKGGYDLGIVVDPDVDRLVLVMENGQPFGEEYTLVAIGDYFMMHRPGNTVSNLSSTRALRDVTEKAGCNYSPAAVGEVNVVTKMKEVHAVVGGEGNGGIIVPDFHFGRDALIGIGLFLSHLARSKKKVSKLRKDYPEYFISKNKIELTPTINVDKVLQGVQEKYKSEKINLTDGVRIDFEKEREWVHLRKSNTEAIVRIIAESKTEKRATELANQLIKDMRKIVKG